MRVIGLGDELQRLTNGTDDHRAILKLKTSFFVFRSSFLILPTMDSAVVFDKVSFGFDDHVVLQDVSFTLARGRTLILLGASGAGKSVVLKLILGLLHPDAGKILVNGHDVGAMRERDLLRIRADIGMLFQENALFDSLTVDENVGYRLYEESDMPLDQVHQRVVEVLGFVG